MSSFPGSDSSAAQGLNPFPNSSTTVPVRRSTSVMPLFATLRVFEPGGIFRASASPAGPAGETGPASVAVMAAGAAAGFAFMRRKRNK